MNILAYGTLREGDYNYARMQNYFGKDSIKKIGEIILPNYKMYNLGSYPCIVESDDENDKVVFDKLEVSDECFNAIRSMELGAGYTEKQINLQLDDYRLYIFTDISLDYSDIFYPRILSGDWFNK